MEGSYLKIREVCNLLNAQVLAREDLLDNEIYSAFGSDLMSDVLTFAHGRMALLTGLNSPQVIRTAEMSDIPLIIFVRGRNLSQNIINMAVERSICLLGTEYIMYEACGKLYEAGLPPCTRLHP
ncbi:MAG: hypothetical protein PWP27_759 [Clostridiales bacterium]|jgi:predicted transcriptional regulator|nr:hypothetical protein [Clostridiales bacterium]